MEILLNHSSLECTAVGSLTFRVRDRGDPTGATIDIDIDEDGRPLGCRADRPRAVGKKAAPTPWFGTGSEFHECEGLRVPTRLGGLMAFARRSVRLFPSGDQFVCRHPLRS